MSAPSQTGKPPNLNPFDLSTYQSMRNGIMADREIRIEAGNNLYARADVLAYHYSIVVFHIREPQPNEKALLLHEKLYHFHSVTARNTKTGKQTDCVSCVSVKHSPEINQPPKVNIYFKDDKGRWVLNQRQGNWKYEPPEILPADW